MPQSYKEAPPEGWKEAQPSDGVLRGKWWEIFGDPALNALEEQVNISNQNVLEVEAQFREAKAAVRVARAALFPLVTGSASVTGSQASSRLNGQAAHPLGTTDVGVGGSYTYDVWGSIHRGIAASADTAQSLAALLENARLLYQAELAVDYFQLHGIDGDVALLGQTVQSYQEYLVLTRNRYAGGVASDSDVAQAETQLYTTQAQLTDLEVQRAQLEHGIAILIGQPPAGFSVPRAPIQAPPPQIPVRLAFGSFGTPPRYRGSGASGRRREPTDRHRHGGILSDPDVRRLRRTRIHEFHQLDHLAQPFLDHRTATGADSVRRRQAHRPVWRKPRPATTPPQPTTVRPC